MTEEAWEVARCRSGLFKYSLSVQINVIFLTTTTVLYFNAVCACHCDKPKPCLCNLLCTLFNLLCTTLLYLYTQISSLSLSSVSFLMKGRTTLHKGHQKPHVSSLLFVLCDKVFNKTLRWDLLILVLRHAVCYSCTDSMNNWPGSNARWRQPCKYF